MLLLDRGHLWLLDGTRLSRLHAVVQLVLGFTDTHDYGLMLIFRLDCWHIQADDTAIIIVALNAIVIVL